MALSLGVKTIPHLSLSCLVALATLANAITPEQFASLQTRSPQPTAASLEAVAGHGSKVVAVGTRGGAVRSLDGGTTWSAMEDFRVGDNRRDLYGVATDGTRFVAVGTNGAVTTDLESWQVSPDSLGGFRLDVVYGDGKFVAAERSATIAVSPDGMEWTLADLPEGTSLESIAYGDGIFVGAGTNARIVRSTNATDWEVVKEDDETAGRFRGVSYANGLFIAAGDDGLLYTSPDGLAWAKPAHESTTNLSKTVYFNGQYIIKDTLSSTQLTTDFLTFERNRFGGTGSASVIAIVGDRLVGVGSGGYLATSEDGVTWTARRELLGESFDSAVFAQNRFVMSDVGAGRLFTSTNGAVWTQRYQSDSGFRTEIAEGGGQFCIINGDRECVRSVDGRTWQTHPLEINLVVDGLRYANGRFLVIGRSGRIASSVDGITWTDHETGSEAFLSDINYHNGIYVAVGSEDTLLTSPDLVTWTERTSGLETTDRKSFSRIEVARDQFYLFQSLGVPAVSSDGINWSFIEGNNLRFFATATGVDEDLGVYTLASGQVIYNAPENDLGDWDRLNVPVASNFLALAGGNGIAVGVGRSGLVMSSALEAGGYVGWATEQFGAMAEAGVKAAIADPDGDGVRNLEEYVRGTDPNAVTSGLPITQTATSFGPEVTWTQGAELNDVQTTVEHSADLQMWTTEGISLNDRDPVDGVQTFSARITGEAGLEKQRCIRIRWSLVQ